jgi:carbonic anhydrase
MCIACSSRRPDRRHFLSLAAAGITAASVFGARTALAAGAAASVTADEALARLKAGNEKYLAAPQVCAADLLKQREAVAKSQAPWAIILTCSDSRVPPELLFGGVGLGELFVARNAGNMADTATMGTIEYGVEHLGAPLVVVMGHERCGAVAAACEVVDKHIKLPGSIGPMVDAIVPAAEAVHGQPGDFVDNAVRESAKRTAHQLATASPILSRLVKEGRMKVVPAYYALNDGKVEFLA